MGLFIVASCSVGMGLSSSSNTVVEVSRAHRLLKQVIFFFGTFEN